MKKFFILTLSTALIVSCGKNNVTFSIQITPAIPVTPIICRDGLASIDLDGQCRAYPNATMGALEAVESLTQ